MSGGRALVVGGGLLAPGAVLVALAGALNEPSLAAAGSVCVLGVFMVRQAWEWGCHWLVMIGAIGVVALVAFATQRVT